MALFEELKQRNVFRVAAAYAVVSWLVLQIVSVVEPALHLPDWTDTLVTVLVMLGFPIALVLAWVFDLTPEGIRRTASLPRESGSERNSGRRLDFLIIGALVLALGYFVADKFWLRPPVVESAPTAAQTEPLPEPVVAPAKSIAVLPFDNRSEIEADQFFVDGIHDDLLTQIARIRDIKTISRTSVQAYRNTTKNMRTIGEELGVSTILEGGVQRAGAQVRINMQLIDARTDAHLWADTYTRELTAENIFHIQSEITASVATALKAILSPEEQQRLDRLPTDNLEALEAYFRGRQGFADATSQSYDEAIRQFKRATELDPGFAAAWSSQGQALVDLIWYRGLNANEQLEKARPLIDRAIELDPESSQAWNAQGKWHRYAGNLEEAEQAYERAIALGPNNAFAFADWGNLKLWQRRDAPAAIELFRTAVALDPNNLGVLTQLCEALGNAGQGDEAIALLEQALTDQPEHAGAWRVLAQLQANHLQHFDESIRSLRRAYALDPDQPWIAQRISEAYFELAAPEPAIYWIDRAVALAPDSNEVHGFRGLAHTYRNEIESAKSEFRHVTPSDDTYGFAMYLLTEFEGLQGDAGPAITAWIAARPALAKDPPEVTPENAQAAARYCWMLMATGQPGRSQVLCRAAAETLRQVPGDRNPWLLNSLAASHAVLDEREPFLEAFKAWVDAGSVSEYGLNDPAFAPWLDDPDFARLVDIVRERQAQQKARLALWEARGELSPVPPLPGE